MRFRVLAADYDGTLAHHGRMAPSTVAALHKLKASGRKLVMVTGRQLDDLQANFPEVDRVFDRVVAENGALLYTPFHQGDPGPGRAARPPVHRAAERTRAGLGRRRSRHRGHLGAARGGGARADPGDGARAAGDLQQGRGHGAAVGPEQGHRAAGRARGPRAVARATPWGWGTPRTTTPSCRCCECGVAVANALPSVKAARRPGDKGRPRRRGRGADRADHRGRPGLLAAGAGPPRHPPRHRPGGDHRLGLSVPAPAAVRGQLGRGQVQPGNRLHRGARRAGLPDLHHRSRGGHARSSPRP